MKHLHRAIGMMMLSLFSLYGAEILALPEGREMQVHAWADPEKILVPSESGTRTYSR